MNESQTECGYAEDLNPFLVGTLDAERRREFLEHLAACPSCPATLDALREDEKLASAPLTPEERKQIGNIVQMGMRLFREGLERDRRIHESEARGSNVLFAVPTFVWWQSAQARRALIFALLFALLALLMLWIYGRG